MFKKGTGIIREESIKAICRICKHNEENKKYVSNCYPILHIIEILKAPIFKEDIPSIYLEKENKEGKRKKDKKKRGYEEGNESKKEIFGDKYHHNLFENTFQTSSLSTSLSLYSSYSSSKTSSSASLFVSLQDKANTLNLLTELLRKDIPIQNLEEIIKIAEYLEREGNKERESENEEEREKERFKVEIFEESWRKVGDSASLFILEAERRRRRREGNPSSFGVFQLKREISEVNKLNENVHMVKDGEEWKRTEENKRKIEKIEEEEEEKKKMRGEKEDEMEDNKEDQMKNRKELKTEKLKVKEEIVKEDDIKESIKNEMREMKKEKKKGKEEDSIEYKTNSNKDNNLYNIPSFYSSFSSSKILSKNSSPSYTSTKKSSSSFNPQHFISSYHPSVHHPSANSSVISFSSIKHTFPPSSSLSFSSTSKPCFTSSFYLPLTTSHSTLLESNSRLSLTKSKKKK